MASASPLTADDLLHVDMPSKRTELVRGRLIVSEPPGYWHGQVTAELFLAIGVFVKAQNLGRVVASETGFQLGSDPDTVRAADVAFVSRDRVPDPPPLGYAEMAPDLAVEVLSPHDRPGKVLAKVADWLEAGSRVVWVVDPLRREARVYRSDGSESLVVKDGALDGEDVLPGFSCPMTSIC